MLFCDADDCSMYLHGFPWDLGYEVRADGMYSCASVTRTRKMSAGKGWTTKRVETEGVAHTADFCRICSELDAATESD